MCYYDKLVLSKIENCKQNNVLIITTMTTFGYYQTSQKLKTKASIIII